MPRPRLKKEGLTLRDVFQLSKAYYKKPKPIGDNKKRRARLDILSVRITKRNNLKFNRSIKQWEQTGRNIELTCIVKTDPVSYDKQDTVKVHKYPVTFLINDIEKGLDSTFRWRTGSRYKPRFPKKGSTKEQRLKIVNDNIKKGIQLQFFFELEWLLASHNLLYGPNRANKPPAKANPSFEIFFDKHAHEIFIKILVNLLTTKKGALLNQVVKNENRQT